MKSRTFFILILGTIFSLPLSAQDPEASKDTTQSPVPPFKMDSVFRQTEISNMTHLSGMKHLSRKPEDRRNAYLRQLAREVVLNTGPDWYREYGEWEVTGPFVYNEILFHKPKEIERIGQKYYKVTSWNDKEAERMNWDYASQVYIWESDGQPLRVTFGLGMGWHFFTSSYKSWIESGITEKQMFPMHNTPEMTINAW